MVWTAELNGRSFEQTIVLFADKERIVYRFLTHIFDVGVCANYADVVRVRIKLIEGDMLTDEHTDAYSTHVESVQESLNRLLRMFRLFGFLLELKDTLSDSRHYWIMTFLDLYERIRKPLVVLVHLRRPFYFQVRVVVVSMPQPYTSFAAVLAHCLVIGFSHVFW